MKMREIFLFIFLLSLFSVGCKKSSDSSSSGSTDLAANVSGTYSGTFTYGTNTDQGTLVISRQTSTTVNITFTIASQSPVTIPNVVVSDAGGGIINLAEGIHFTGNVNGKSLDCTILISYHFVGTKP